MATEILVNDGGAPARILPFFASGGISGGMAVDVVDGTGTPDGWVIKAAAHGAAAATIGYALTDVSSGETASIITGKGIVINAMTSGTIDEGDLLMVAADGSLAAGITTANGAVAVALEINSDNNTLARVITL